MIVRTTLFAFLALVLSIPIQAQKLSEVTPSHFVSSYDVSCCKVVGPHSEELAAQEIYIFHNSEGRALATAQSEPATCDGGCHDIDDPTFQSPPTEEVDGCEWRVHRIWSDGCHGYHVYNPCTLAYEVDSSGVQIFHWICCAE